MSGPLHIGLIPTVGPYLLPILSRCCTRPFQSWKCICMKPDPPVTGATGQRQTRLRDPRLVKESEAFIEVPLFDEPMLLLSMKTTRGRTANAYRWPIWRGKTADAGRWSLFARSGNGFCFEAGADEDTHFRATSLETLATWWRQVAGSLYCLRWLCRRTQTRWGCLSAVH